MRTTHFPHPIARLLVAFALLLLLAACGPRAEEGRLLLEDIEAGPAASELKATTPAPTRQHIDWQVEGRARGGDLYLPGRQPMARMVLVPGLSPDGKDDIRLVALAESLARVRFAVLVPEVEGVRELQVGADDARLIADAVVHLAGRDIAGSPPGPVGLTAVSYAVGPAVLAGLEPDVAPHLDLLVGIGGYYDMMAVITFMTTGAWRAADGTGSTGPWRRGAPSPYGRWYFLAGNADRLDDPRDRALLRAIADRRLANPAAVIDDLTLRLGPEGRAVLALLEADDPDRVPALVAALPAPMRREIAALSLAERSLSAFPGRALLIHGRSDPVIPASESQRLAAALPASAARLTLVDRLDHVDFRERPTLSDRLQLLDAAQYLLLIRDLRAAGR